MFAFLLLLTFACLGHLVVDAFPASDPALLQLSDISTLSITNDTTNPIASFFKFVIPQPYIFHSSNANHHSSSDTGHHWDIPNTRLTLHITVPANALPLPPAETLKLLHSFILQLKLHPKNEYLDHNRYVVYDDLQATIAPSKSPSSNITFKDSATAIAALWIYASRNNLLFEMRFAVFDNGRMVAWGTMAKRGGVNPRPPDVVQTVETA